MGTAPAERVVGRTFNAGTGGEISVGDLVTLIGKVMDTVIDVREDAQRIRPANSEVMRLVADATRLGEATGWSPGHDLEQGLAHHRGVLPRPGQPRPVQDRHLQHLTPSGTSTKEEPLCTQ